MKKIFILLIITTLNLSTEYTNSASASIQTNQKDLNKQLFQAVEEDNLNTVQRLIAAGADVSIQDRRSRGRDNALLHIAAIFGNLDVIRTLIDAGANVNIKNNIGQTPLHVAASQGSVNIVQALIDADANVNIKNNIGQTPLHLAVISRQNHVVQALIDAGANIDVKDQNGWTPLHWALTVDVTQSLIDAGANVNTRNNIGETPLHIAAIRGQADVAQALIDAGANINIENNAGKTPLYLALEGGRTEIAQTLIDAGANFGEDEVGYTPLYSEAQDYIQQYLQNVANIEQQLGTLNPTESVKDILDQYDQDLRNTMVKRLISQNRFDLAIQILEAYPEVKQIIENNLYFIKKLKSHLMQKKLGQKQDKVEFTDIEIITQD